MRFTFPALALLVTAAAHATPSFDEAIINTRKLSNPAAGQCEVAFGTRVTAPWDTSSPNVDDWNGAYDIGGGAAPVALTVDSYSATKDGAVYDHQFDFDIVMLNVGETADFNFGFSKTPGTTLPIVTEVSETVSCECALVGDDNDDLMIGAADLLAFLGAYGNFRTDTGYVRAKDFNGDGIIGTSDLLDLLATYGLVLDPDDC